MTLRSHISKKTAPYSATPVQNPLQSRPFVIPAQPETSQPETPDLQTQLENAQRFGHSCSKIAASSRAIQPKLTIGAPGDQYEQEADSLPETLRDRVAAQVVQRLNVSGEGRSQPAQEPAQPEQATQQEATPDLQTQLQTQIETAQRFGHSFSKIAASSRAIIQPKLTIGAPGDPYEQEADRVAAQVVQRLNAPPSNPSSPARSQSDPSVQQETLPDEDELQMKPMADQIQRVDMPEEEELQMKSMVQRQVGDEAVTASANLESAIQQSRGSGQPLADDLRQPMEQAFGNVDFSGVKVHTDTQSDQLNRSIQAKAFTTGQDIFFRQGAYEPGSRGGQELIAHELTHVVQQNGGAVSKAEEARKSTPKIQTSLVQGQNTALLASHSKAGTKFLSDKSNGQEETLRNSVMLPRLQAKDCVIQLMSIGNQTKKKHPNAENEVDAANQIGDLLTKVDAVQDRITEKNNEEILTALKKIRTFWEKWGSQEDIPPQKYLTMSKSYKDLAEALGIVTGEAEQLKAEAEAEAKQLKAEAEAEAEIKKKEEEERLKAKQLEALAKAAEEARKKAVEEKREHDSTHTHQQLTSAQVVKAAGYRGATSVHPFYGGRDIMIREGNNHHFTQFRKNYDTLSFPSDTSTEKIVEAVFGGSGELSFHVTQELHGKVEPARNPHLYSSGTFKPGESHKTEESWGADKLQRLLTQELTRIKKVLVLYA